MLSALLAERERQGKPIRVGIIGAGKFGGGLVAQIAQMQGMVVAAIADIDLAPRPLCIRGGVRGCCSGNGG